MFHTQWDRVFVFSHTTSCLIALTPVTMAAVKISVHVRNHGDPAFLVPPSVMWKCDHKVRLLRDTKYTSKIPFFVTLFFSTFKQ